MDEYYARDEADLSQEDLELRGRRKRRIGTVLLVLGFLAAAAALILTASNHRDDIEAGKSALADLHKMEETFEMPKDWNAEEYFDGCFGIIADQRVEPQNVKLKVSAGQANYIRDLKLHDSQEEIEKNDEYSIFSYMIRPEYDFMQEILRNGENMEVLEPDWLRQEMSGIIKRMNDKYSKE